MFPKKSAITGTIKRLLANQCQNLAALQHWLLTDDEVAVQAKPLLHPMDTKPQFL